MYEFIHESTYTYVYKCMHTHIHINMYTYVPDATIGQRLSNPSTRTRGERLLETPRLTVYNR
jgi:hypothetical protein